MPENKTQETDDSVLDFLKSVDNEKRRTDAMLVYDLMNSISREPAKLWGSSIIGYDRYHYKYESGREGDFFKIGFSPRKQSLSLYILNGFQKNGDLLEKLGKYKLSKACLYINKLEDVDLEVLKELVQESYDYMTKKYG